MSMPTRVPSFFRCPVWNVRNNVLASPSGVVNPQPQCVRSLQTAKRQFIEEFLTCSTTYGEWRRALRISLVSHVWCRSNGNPYRVKVCVGRADRSRESRKRARPRGRWLARARRRGGRCPTNGIRRRARSWSTSGGLLALLS